MMSTIARGEREARRDVPTVRPHAAHVSCGSLSEGRTGTSNALH